MIFVNMRDIVECRTNTIMKILNFLIVDINHHYLLTEFNLYSLKV